MPNPVAQSLRRDAQTRLDEYGLVAVAPTTLQQAADEIDRLEQLRGPDPHEFARLSRTVDSLIESMGALRDIDQMQNQRLDSIAAAIRSLGGDP